MSNYFDSDKLKEVLKNYYRVTKIRIAILDTDYNDIEGYPKERSSVCNYIRSNHLADSHCKECDKKACNHVKETLKPYLYKCHAGLYECIQPLTINGILFGYIFFAHMLSGKSLKDCSEEIKERTAIYSLDSKTLEALVEKEPLLELDYIRSASFLLETIATNLCLEKMGYIKKYDDLPIQINHYINEHISEDISIKDVCKSLGIGKTKLSTISNQYFKCGIHSHIRNLKIEKAKEILRSDNNISLYDVALQCGFNDYNYFIQIFKTIVGITPKKYQTEQNKNFLSNQINQKL